MVVVKGCKMVHKPSSVLELQEPFWQILCDCRTKLQRPARCCLRQPIHRVKGQLCKSLNSRLRFRPIITKVSFHLWDPRECPRRFCPAWKGLKTCYFAHEISQSTIMSPHSHIYSERMCPSCCRGKLVPSRRVLLEKLTAFYLKPYRCRVCKGRAYLIGGRLRPAWFDPRLIDA